MKEINLQHGRKALISEIKIKNVALNYKTGRFTDSIIF